MFPSCAWTKLVATSSKGVSHMMTFVRLSSICSKDKDAAILLLELTKSDSKELMDDGD